MPSRREIEIVYDILRARQAMKVLTGDNEKFEESLENIETQTQALNALGIRTQAQIEREITRRRELVRLLGSAEPAAVATLSAEIEQLSLQQQGLAVQTRQAEQAFFGFGFILDDARQFTVDTASGIRAIANNFQPLLQNLSAVERQGPGFLGFLKGLKAGLTPATIAILAINAATLIYAFALSKQSEAQKKAEKSAKNYAAELFKVRQAERDIFAPATTSRAEDYIRVAESLIDVNERQARSISLSRYEASISGLIKVTDLTQAQKQRLDELNISTERAKEIVKTYNEQIAEQVVIQELINEGKRIGVDLLRQENQVMTGLAEEHRDLALEKQFLLELNPATVETVLKLNEALEAEIRAIRTHLGLPVKKEREEKLSLLEKTWERQRDLVKAINEFNKAANVERRLLDASNEELQERLDLMEKIFRAQEGFGIDTSFVEIVPEDSAEIIEDDLDETLRAEREWQRQYRAEVKKRKKTQDEIVRDQERFQARLAGAIAGGLANTLASTIEAIGAGENLTKALLAPFGTMLIQLGRIAIMTGVGIEGIKKALASLNPIVAFAAGAALLAFGAFIRGQVQDLGRSGGSSGPAAPRGLGSGLVRGGGSVAPGVGFRPPIFQGTNPFTGDPIFSGGIGTVPPALGGDRRVFSSPGAPVVNVFIEPIAGETIRYAVRRAEIRRSR